MPWDSTGQPEVYAWLRHFGKQAKADTTREVILGYDPVMPSWGYNGNARRYWDFLYGGKIRRVERQIHHYGSTLNAVPLFDAFRAKATLKRNLEADAPFGRRLFLAGARLFSPQL